MSEPTPVVVSPPFGGRLGAQPLLHQLASDDEIEGVVIVQIRKGKLYRISYSDVTLNDLLWAREVITDEIAKVRRGG
jgi:hypothetical protein|tara:strand:+ start:561 stop:791 length:231 start_codon:yes stop_codon:yes gene_type:complete